ncbi:MAG: DUF4159 domain-containing protein [Litorilinea sp.]
MFTSELLRMFPRKRIKPMDGMAVTAEVWEEAHEYHRQLGRFHALLLHGAGIVTGLEVIASEPPDSSLYILPGIAVDPLGQTIVLPEPRAYDLGRGEGLLYLIVSYNESRPRVAATRAEEDTPRYVHEQFLLEAVTELPQTPHVELARIRRQGGERPVRDAANRKHPRSNEIDLRFRHSIGVTQSRAAQVGVVTLPGAGEIRHGEGMENVAQFLERSGGRAVWVDASVTLDRPLDGFDLLYVVGRDQFTLNSDQMNALYSFWQGGGTLFYESCRRSDDQNAPGGDRAFRDLLESFGVELNAVAADHPLLRRPHLFGQLPDGFETRGSPVVDVGEGVVFSTFDFGCMWVGERRGRGATRSEIRNAMDWAENLVDFAVARRSQGAQNGAASNGTGNNDTGDPEPDTDESAASENRASDATSDQA